MIKHLRVLLLALAFTGSAFAQVYPNRPIRLVVPFSAGGSVDMVARMVGQKLGESMGQPVLVDNRAGASGNIGMDVVAKSPADGYTLLMASAALTANMHLYAKMSFDPLKDLQPIIKVADQPSVLVVHPSLGVKNVQELIALLRSKPGKLTFGSAGLGSAQQIAAEIFMMKTGTKMLHVPYKGGAPAVVDTVSNQTQVLFSAGTQTLPHVKAGKLRLLGVTEAKRSPLLPDAPTVAETLPGYALGVWYGAFGPANMPTALVTKLNDEINKALAQPEVRTRMDSMGVEIVKGTPQQFAAVLRSDADRYGKVIRELGIKNE